MAFEPFILAAATLTLDGDAYEGQISGAVFTPSGNAPVVFKPINGQSKSKTPAADWALEISLAQDWNEATALSRYLHENEGADVAAVFTPEDGGPTVTATVSITPGQIGMGDASSIVASTVSLGSSRPVLGAVA